MNSDIMVSIICKTYNHEKYIEEAIKGFIKQKTSFKFEVIIHDDASTDSTADIIRKYEKEYPEIIKPIYQVENLFRSGIPIDKTYIMPKARGKYVAWCEGDDYWTDEFKLQSQVDALEQNPSCVACLSKVEKVTLQGVPLKRFIPETLKADGIICGNDFVNYVLDPGIMNGFPVQITGLMVLKDIYQKYCIERPDCFEGFRKIHVGDIPLALYIGLHGDVYYIDKVMSHYRTGNTHSFIGITHKSSKESAAYFRKKANAYKAFDEATHDRFHESASKAIQYAEFSALRDEHDVYRMKSAEYCWLYDTLSLKGKILQHIFYYSPLLEKPAKKLKRYFTNHGIIK